MHEIHVGVGIEPSPRRQGRFVELGDEANRTQYKADQQGSHRTGSIDPPIENTDQEDGGHRRGDVGLDRLKVVVNLS